MTTRIPVIPDREAVDPWAAPLRSVADEPAAADNFNQLLGIFHDYLDAVEEWQEKPVDRIFDWDNRLANRAYNALYDDGIQTVGQLITLSEAEVLMVPGIGPKMLDHIMVKLHEHNLSLNHPYVEIQ